MILRRASNRLSISRATLFALDLVGRQAQAHRARMWAGRPVSGTGGRAFSHASMRLASIDSGSPAVIIVRWTICRSAKRVFRRGITSSSIRCSISNGTPGSETTTCPSRSNHMPGAVPWALNSTVQHAGTIACERLSSLNSMPRSASIFSTCPATRSS